MIIRNNAAHQRASYIVNQTNEMRACTMRVVLADDHPFMLGGLRALLQAERGVEIAAAALEGATALKMIRAHEPEIAVLDITMPRLTGLEVLEALEADGLATRVVLLTGSASDGQIATAVERGAWGLLLKESAPGTLIVCLKTVAAGQRWLPEELVAPAIRRAAERRATDVRPERVLTAREYEIARLIAQGLVEQAHRARSRHLGGDGQDPPAQDVREAWGRDEPDLPCRADARRPRPQAYSRRLSCGLTARIP